MSFSETHGANKTTMLTRHWHSIARVALSVAHDQLDMRRYSSSRLAECQSSIEAAALSQPMSDGVRNWMPDGMGQEHTRDTDINSLVLMD
jgi:hypothetical protein